MDEVIAVSACLLGFNCKYDGGNNLDPRVVEYVRNKTVIPICPESFGGLPTPRIPSEIVTPGALVKNARGEDVTAYFDRGKKVTLELLKKHRCTQAILKDGSPSCGFSYVYDGTFSGTTIPGRGETASHLLAGGVRIVEVK
ncbi:MAG: DUF523 domain-containing protein [Candidatus Izemoplasmatales bacterium]